MQHDFAVGVKHRGEGPRSRDARIVIDAVPRGDGGMDIAIGSTKSELLLDLRRESGAVFDSTGRFWGVAAHPGVLKLIIRITRNHVEIPELIHRGEIRVVVVRTVNETKLVLHQPGVIIGPLVAAFTRRGFSAESKTFTLVAPQRFVIRYDHLGHAIAVYLGPVTRIVFSVRGSMRAPDSGAGNVPPG